MSKRRAEIAKARWYLCRHHAKEIESLLDMLFDDDFKQHEKDLISQMIDKEEEKYHRITGRYYIPRRYRNI